MTGTGPGRIFHLMPRRTWEEQQRASALVAIDQLERHGFVHCCTREQIVEVANWWLAEQAPLVAVEIAAELAGDVRFERADLGRRYPHVYNAIPPGAVVAAHALPVTRDGRFVLPPALAAPPPSFHVDIRRGGKIVTMRWADGQLDGDADVVAAAHEALLRGAMVTHFPGVTKPASLATPYDAFCLLAALADEVVGYRGDGFEPR